MYKIMIIGYDPKIGEMLQVQFNKYGLQDFIPKNFKNILDVFFNIQPHLVLININLSHFDGYYWCRQIRSVSICPIIFISEKGGEMDQIMALEHGADDYVIEPIYHEILIAKIQAYLRRAYGEYAQKIEERTVQQSGLILYPERATLQLNKKVISLTKNETTLIELLLKQCPYTVSRELILEKLWNNQKYGDENILSVNITRTRKKLEKIGIYGAVQTVRGKGYRLKVTWKIDSD
ncbi:response regulator transcription factor (plasmid) [Bacillus mycoides]|nr:response regulator transcription factor [Bacillus mycoides]